MSIVQPCMLRKMNVFRLKNSFYAYYTVRISETSFIFRNMQGCTIDINHKNYFQKP